MSAAPGHEPLDLLLLDQVFVAASRSLRAARGTDPAARANHADTLARVDGPSWLALAREVRDLTADEGAAAGWDAEDVHEPTGLVAVLASMHADGHVRERAVRALAGRTDALAARALALCLLDHVPQVRDQAWAALEPVLSPERAGTVLDVLRACPERQLSIEACERVQAALHRAAPGAGPTTP